MGRPPPIFWVLLAVIGTCVAVVALVAAREIHAQDANRRDCNAARGAYIRVGDKYFSGICVRSGGLIWDRRAAQEQPR